MQSKTEIAEAKPPDHIAPLVYYLRFLSDGKKRSVLLYFVQYTPPRMRWYESYIWDLETDKIIPILWSPPISVTPVGTKLTYIEGGT